MSSPRARPAALRPPPLSREGPPAARPRSGGVPMATAKRRAQRAARARAELLPFD